MKNKTGFIALMVILCVASFAFIYGCGSNPSGGGSSSSTSNRVGTYIYGGTQSPGDVWSWTISTETFSGTNETTGMWLTGTWVVLSSGFSNATVSTSGGPDAPPVGGHAYFLEFPNTMLLVKPDNSSDSRVMVCAASATLEPSPGKFLFVNIPKDNWSSSSPAYGTVEATKSGGKWHFNVTDYLITGEYAGNDPGTDNFVWSNGTFTNETTPTNKTKIFMTPSNLFFGDSGPNKGGFAGASLEGISDVSLVLNHVYKGVRFIYCPAGASSTGETEAIRLTKIAGVNGLLVERYTDVDNNTYGPAGDGITITFEAAQNAKGFIPAIVNSLSAPPFNTGENIQCVFSSIGPADNRKYLLFGIGLDNTNRPYNFLLIQTD